MKTPLKNVKNTKYLLGWTNIKWFLHEMVLIYSSKKSFFLKKEWNQVLVLQLRVGYDFFLIKSMML
jgi:hypothetical protein